MAKVSVKRSCVVFPNRVAGLTTILVVAVLFLLCCIAVKGYAVPDVRTVLRDGIVTESGGAGRSAFGESKIPTGAERQEPNSIAENAAGDSPRSDEWQSVQMCVTAYCPCSRCCGDYSDGRTACGHEIRPGDAFVAADKKYRFRTEMVIPGYKDEKPVKVLDRGGAIRGNKLDVFFHSHEAALEWGVRYLDVKVRRN